MSRIILTGSETGLGECLKDALLLEGHEVIGFDLKISPFHDVRSSVHCRNFAQLYEDKHVDVLINCAGVNRIDYLEEFSEGDWNLVMDTNAKGIFNMTKALLPSLSPGGTILNITSNASHIPMTSSLAYNASKGAAHIMTLQLARELGPRHHITVFGVAPNRLADTEMSRYIDQRCCEVRGWTPEFAREYQLKALPAREETDPRMVADFIAYLLQTKRHHKYLAGTIIPYGA